MIEKTISDLTTAINGLTAAIQHAQTGAPVAQAPAPAAAAHAMPAPPFQAPIPAPVQPAMFQAPAPAAAPVGPTAPFTDGAGLINYVMAVYKEIGPAKGAQIQGVLTGMGYQNINDVTPGHYGALFTGVEALRG